MRPGSMNSRVDAVARREEAVLGQDLGLADQGLGRPALLGLEPHEALDERHQRGGVLDRVGTSMIRTSRVPRIGWGRASHHRNVGSGIAPARISASTPST